MRIQRRLTLLTIGLSACGLEANPYALTASAPSHSKPAPVITQPVDETQRVTLVGNTRGEALRPELDQGAVEDSLALNGIELQLKMPEEREAAASALSYDMQNPASPNYHQWLTAEQYGEQFGVHPDDIATVSAWLRSHGFTVEEPTESRMVLTFSGNAKQVKEAFGTEIHYLSVKGVQHIANVSDPSIPLAIAPAVEGIVSLHDFRPKRLLATSVPQYTFPGVDAPFYALVPADLAQIYGFSSVFAGGLTGKGQTIALLQDSDVYNPADWTTFRHTFGLDTYKGASFTTVHPGKSCVDPGVNANGDDLEAILDAEWSSAAAPGASIEEVACANTTTTYGVVIGLQGIINARNLPSIISISYGDCESDIGAAGNAAYESAYLQAALEGISVYVAAGDNGAAICDNYTGNPVQYGISVNGLASTEYNVAVGGTDFGDYYSGTAANYWAAGNGANYESALSYVPEIPWNDTCVNSLLTSYLGYASPFGANGFCATPLGYVFQYPTAGGGGPSNCAKGTSNLSGSDGTCKGRKKPSWQDVYGNGNDGVRDLPDVAMFAADGLWNHAYVFCNSDPSNGVPCVGDPVNWSLSGGTSFASPIMAGLQALVNHRWGPGSQGNAAPYYYARARVEFGDGSLGKGAKSCDSFASGGPASNCTFNDISLGGNDVDCVGPYNCYAPDGAGTVGDLSLSDHADKPAFSATRGWDFATGLGSVNANVLVQDTIWKNGWTATWAQGYGPW